MNAIENTAVVPGFDMCGLAATYCAIGIYDCLRL